MSNKTNKWHLEIWAGGAKVPGAEIVTVFDDPGKKEEYGPCLYDLESAWRYINSCQRERVENCQDAKAKKERRATLQSLGSSLYDEGLDTDYDDG